MRSKPPTTYSFPFNLSNVHLIISSEQTVHNLSNFFLFDYYRSWIKEVFANTTITSSPKVQAAFMPIQLIGNPSPSSNLIVSFPEISACDSITMLLTARFDKMNLNFYTNTKS